MGTRHEIKIILDGEIKVCQYGQWDGYPTGQGEAIANFLQKNIVGKPRNLRILKNRVRNLSFLTDSEIEHIENHYKGIWMDKFPWLSRDCGAGILDYIYQGDVEKILCSDEKENRKWCEYFYMINLDNETVSKSGGGVKYGKEYPFNEWTIKKMKQLK